MNSDTTSHQDHTMTDNMHAARTQASTNRRSTAHHKLDQIIEHHADGYLPEHSASMAGYATVKSAREVARKYGRDDVMTALKAYTPAEKRAHRIEDLNFLLDVSEHPDRAVKRVGWIDRVRAIFDLTDWGHEDTADRLRFEVLPSDDYRAEMAA